MKKWEKDSYQDDGSIRKNMLVQCEPGWVGVIKDEAGELRRGASVIAFSVSYKFYPDDGGYISNQYVEPIFNLQKSDKWKDLDSYGLMRPDGHVEYGTWVFASLDELKKFLDEENERIHCAREQPGE